MTETLLTDTATVSGVRKTRQGFLVGQCRIAKGNNIQVYSGIETGTPDKETVRVYRPPEVVFDADTAKGWAFRPVSVLHPRSGSITSENWAETAVGSTGGEVLRDGQFISVPMMLADAEAIDLVERGVVTEVSCGYLVALDATPGKTPDGEEYDMAIKTMVPDHVALVLKGRAGSDCRFGDGASEVQAKDSTPQQQGVRAVPEDTRTIMVDGLTIPVTNQGAEAIHKLQTQLLDAQTKADTQRSAQQALLDAATAEAASLRQQLADATAAKDGELGALKATHATTLADAQARIAELEARTQPAALEAMAAQRAATVSVAQRYLGDAFNGAGFSDGDIRKAVVMKGMNLTQAEVDARAGEPRFFDHAFEVFAREAVKQAAKPAAPQPDPLRQAIASGAGFPALDAATPQPGKAYQEHLNWVQNAWKTPAPTIQGAH